VTLELSQLSEDVRTMGEVIASRQQTTVDLVNLARQWLADHADDGPALQRAARNVQKTAIPTEEPLDAVRPLPTMPERFTVAAADGSQIQPDRHGAALFHLINVGSLVYRHGSGEAPEAKSESTLGYTEDDLYEHGMPVAGNLLDVRRDLAELKRLADASVDEQPGRTVALVDGSIVLWVLKDLPGDARITKIAAYLDQLDRIRQAGAVVGGYISRPGYDEVTRLLYLASLNGDTKKAEEQPNPLEHLPDRAIFATLPPGARSALFVSPKDISQTDYARRGHEVHFFYLNVVEEDGREPVIARVEVPAWVADHAGRLDLVHGAVVAQARITGDYPYALARADELAYISSRERAAFEEMVLTALLRAGVRSTPSPKAHYKRLTRMR
jgi:hypothetical protein